jgi:hypothetical protein
MLRKGVNGLAGPSQPAALLTGNSAKMEGVSGVNPSSNMVSAIFPSLRCQVPG